MPDRNEPSRRIPATAGPEAPLDLVPVLTLLLRSWRSVAAALVVATGAGLLHAFVAPVRYTTSMALVVAQPQGTLRLGSLAALASRLGAGAPTTAGAGNPRFYLATLQLPAVLDSVLTTSLPDRGESTLGADVRDGGGTLLEWYRIDTSQTPARRLEVGRKRLLQNLEASFDDRSDILTVRVTDADRQVAVEIARLLVANLQRVSLHAQQTTSAATREFLEERLTEAQAELSQAEEALRGFLQQNRQYEDSPSLRLEAARLQRRIDLRQQVFLELSTQVEEARSAEVRDTPLLTVVQEPIPPVRRSAPRRKLILALWLVLGGCFGVAWVGLRAWAASQASAGSPAWRELREELATAGQRGSHPTA